MRFTVTWTDQAESELCQLWMAVPDRNELSRVVNSLEQEFAHRPDTVGESRDKNVRVVMESSFGVMFDVSLSDRLVQVLHIGWLP